MDPMREEAEEFIGHLIPSSLPSVSFFDEKIIFQIQRRLIITKCELFRQWIESPRLFIILRMLGHEDSVLQQFIDANVNDFWLPISKAISERLIIHIDWNEFRRYQRYMLSNSAQLTEARLLETPGMHHRIEYGTELFDDIEHLGDGATATVFKVRYVAWDTEGRGSCYACKRARRGNGRQQEQRIQLFVQELRVLRRLIPPNDHRHLIRLVASYTDMQNFALVLHPVAERTLWDVLYSTTVPITPAESRTLYRWTGCLVSALAHLHSLKIRHKDIKPSNILLSNNNVYICDFGISRDWTGLDPTTEGPSHRTPGYCAPEFMEGDPRSQTADIWSMGRVFCDIAAVLSGRMPVELIASFGNSLADVYQDGGLRSLDTWISSLAPGTASSSFGVLVENTRQMIRSEPKARPSARNVLEAFWNHGAGDTSVLVGECCQRPTTDVVNLWSTHNTGHDVAGVATPRLDQQRDFDLASELPTAVNPLPNHDTDFVRQHNDTPTVDIEPSPNSSSAPGTTATEYRTSLGKYSSRSQQLISCSYGSLPVLQPLPVQSSNACNCMPKQSNCQASERLLLSSSLTDVCIRTQEHLREPDRRCGLGSSLVHLYESYPKRGSGQYRIWLKTRRLVVSHKSSSATHQQCSTFWLPLTDLRFALKNRDLTLQWSDCNHWTSKPMRNNKQSFDCVYNPDNANNEIMLSFADDEAARSFLETVCIVYDDAHGATEWHRVEVIGHQSLLVVNTTSQDVKYRVACLTTHQLPFTMTFQVFLHWPLVDLDIHIRPEDQGDGRVMIVRFGHVSMPNYISDLNDQPFKDMSKTARCVESNLVTGSYSMGFPIDVRKQHAVPEGVTHILYDLTGWSMQFFACDVQLLKGASLIDTNYGNSDVMIWHRVHPGLATDRQEVKIAFRHRKVGAKYKWRCGTVDVSPLSKNLTFNLSRAKFTMTQKSHGDFLDTTTMTAVDENRARPLSHGSTELELRFNTETDVTALFKVFKELQSGGRVDSVVRTETKDTVIPRQDNQH